MNILIIFPHGDALNTNSGASTRVFHFVESLVNNNHKVSLLHQSNSNKSKDFTFKKNISEFTYKNLSFLGIPDYYLKDLNPFFIIKLYKIIKSNNFDIIQIEFPWGFFVSKLLKNKNSSLIYSSYGIESRFIDVALKNPKFPAIFKPIARFLVYFYEKLVCKLADAIISVSDYDRNFYIKNFKIDQNKTIAINIPSSIKKPPNIEAFKLIKNYISPKINMNNLLFVLAGKNLKSYSQKKVISLGFVEDLEKLLLCADFAIVPILSGEGQKVKCSDYIVTGLPFISTKKGIQGIDFLKDKEDCLIVDKVDQNFILGILKLYESKELREKMHESLIKKSKYLKKSTLDKKLFNFYEFLVKN
ncbi:MAG: glycosyltransferase family 4 protein [Candidatus Lokiarchaeota archaeon]